MFLVGWVSGRAKGRRKVLSHLRGILLKECLFMFAITGSKKF